MVKACAGLPPPHLSVVPIHLAGSVAFDREIGPGVFARLRLGLDPVLPVAGPDGGTATAR